MRARASQDLLAGLLFTAFGLATIVLSTQYPAGTAERMGPGYFPSLLGWGLVLLGLAITIQGLVRGGGMRPTWVLRPLLLVLGAVLGFGLALERIGLLPATLVLVVVASQAGERVRVVEVLALAVGLGLLGAGVFVYGLGLPLMLWVGM